MSIKTKTWKVHQQDVCLEYECHIIGASQSKKVQSCPMQGQKAPRAVAQDILGTSKKDSGLINMHKHGCSQDIWISDISPLGDSDRRHFPPEVVCDRRE